jgi:hypothetical protein
MFALGFNVGSDLRVTRGKVILIQSRLRFFGFLPQIN